jgi:rhodanese-related sulfurtransferase
VSPRTVAQLLESARSQLDRVTPEQAFAAMRDGALLIDIRAESQRRRDGVVPGSRFMARNVLEWRCDPASEWRDPEAARPEQRQIIMCDQGYQSSLAAATLKELGLPGATDLIGGFQAWRAAGLAVSTDDSA